MVLAWPWLQWTSSSCMVESLQIFWMWVVGSLKIRFSTHLVYWPLVCISTSFNSHFIMTETFDFPLHVQIFSIFYVQKRILGPFFQHGGQTSTVFVRKVWIRILWPVWWLWLYEKYYLINKVYQFCRKPLFFITIDRTNGWKTEREAMLLKNQVPPRRKGLKSAYQIQC